MKKTILAVLIDTRHKSALKVQEILTEYGCLIKTRLGLHDVTETSCSNQGLVLLEMIGDKTKIKEMHDKLNKLPSVQAKKIELKLK